MRVYRVSSDEALLGLRPVWEGLSRSLNSDLIWMTFDWYYEWVRCRRHFEAFVLVVGDSGKPVAIAPWVRSRIVHRGVPLTKIGFVVEEFAGEFLIVAEKAQESIDAVMDYLGSGRESWDVLYLKKIGLESQVVPLLRSRIAAKKLWMAEDSNSLAPYLKIESGWETYLQSLSQKFRQNLRRSLAKLEEKGKVSLRCYASPEEVGAALDIAFNIAKISWQGRQGTGIEAKDKDRSFYERYAVIAAKNGQLDLRTLMVGDRQVAFEYNVRCGSTIYTLKCGYDPEFTECSPGVYLRSLTNQAYFNLGVREIDFMGVSQFWISRWTEEKRAYGDILVYRCGLKTVLPYFLDGALLPVLRRMGIVRTLKIWLERMLVLGKQRG